MIVCDQTFPGLTFHKQGVKTPGHEASQVKIETEKKKKIDFLFFFSGLFPRPDESLSVTEDSGGGPSPRPVPQDGRQVWARSLAAHVSVPRPGPSLVPLPVIDGNIFYCHSWLWGWSGFL